MERVSGTHWIGSSVGPKDGLDTVDNISLCFVQELNSDSCPPDSGVVSAVTELSSESFLYILVRCILGYEFQ